MPLARPTITPGSIGLMLPPMAPITLHDETIRTGSATRVRTFGSTTSITAMCLAAEDAGAGAIWATDHLFWRQPTLECLTTLAVAATATRTAALGTCVLQLPMRSPFAVAKQASALQLLSGGRFVLGVGVGSHPREYELAQTDYHARGRRLDEAIVALRQAWSLTRAPDASRSSGDYLQEPSVPSPVWIGGASPRSLRRAAVLGDGWVPLFLDPATFATRLGQIRAMRYELRENPGAPNPQALSTGVVMIVNVDDDARRAREQGTAWLSALYGIPPRAFERHLVAGSAEYVADRAHRYFSSGATHVITLVAADNPIEHYSALMQAAAPACKETGVATPRWAMAGATS